ncbi:MAG TPA: DUF5681 domain-containing protein, partial [Beijerinckiaceae bacterium]|nr:DUF5681 domain-containing protein [Beijerinckiaceae bacterium]
AEAERILQESFTATENGRRRKRTGAQFFVRRLWALALKGDLKAMKLWIDLVEKAGSFPLATTTAPRLPRTSPLSTRPTRR